MARIQGGEVGAVPGVFLTQAQFEGLVSQGVRLACEFVVEECGEELGANAPEGVDSVALHEMAVAISTQLYWHAQRMSVSDPGVPLVTYNELFGN